MRYCIFITVDQRGILKINSDCNKSKFIDCKMFMGGDRTKEDINLYILLVYHVSIEIEKKISKELADKVRQNYKESIFPQIFKYIEKLENTTYKQSRCS